MRYGIVILLFVSSIVNVLAQSEGGTPQVNPEATAETTEEPGPTPVVIEPLLNITIEPPITIDLPETWLVGYDTLVYTDVDGEVKSIPFALYTGDVSSGNGTIVVLWGFSRVVNPFSGEGGSYLDALRMLRLIIFDVTCNIGTAPQRDYTIGGLDAVGAQFSAVDCPEGQPDTRGWFAAVRVEGVNFAFYNFMDPIQPPGTPVEFELQAILDSVEFHVDEMLVTEAEFEATQQAYMTAFPQAEVTQEATAEATEAAGD